MFYAHYIDANGQERSELLDDWSQFYKDTFSPDAHILYIIDFNLHGKDYLSRKAELSELAKCFQFYCAPGLSYIEMSRICDWFSRYGKRYGLLRDFMENAVC